MSVSLSPGVVASKWLTFVLVRLLRGLVLLRLVGGGGRGGGVHAAVRGLGSARRARAALHADQVLLDMTWRLHEYTATGTRQRRLPYDKPVGSEPMDLPLNKCFFVVNGSFVYTTHPLVQRLEQDMVAQCSKSFLHTAFFQHWSQYHFHGTIPYRSLA